MSRETSHGLATHEQLYRVFGVSRQAVHQSRRARPKAPKVTVGSCSPAFSGVAGALGPAVWVGVSTRYAGRSMPAAVLKPAIRDVVKDHPAWGVRKVWAKLRRQGYRASRKRIYALMRSMGLTLPAHPRRGQATRGHVAVPESNRRWGTDLTKAWTRLDGWVAVVPVLDYGDRFLLDFEVTKDEDSLSVLAPLQRALESEFEHRKNVPHGLELRTDHGPQYTGEDCGQLSFRWKLDHTYAPIGRPTGNSVVERFMLTLKTELIWTQDWESREELEAALRDWAHVYNYDRPHQALSYRTPAECRNQQLNQPTDTAAVAA